MTTDFNNRILLVDDNPAIHEDFRKILIGPSAKVAALAAVESILFDAPTAATSAEFALDSAFQGREALDKVTAALQAGRPYALAFVDVRMPPGWDGIETIARLWEVDPALQVVVCTAYSDYSWEKMTAKLGINDNLVILKKPFDNIEVLQLAHALTKKWHVTGEAQQQVESLDRKVAARTRELEDSNAELRRSEERFAKAFRASPIPFAIQTLQQQRFVDVNDAFVKMTGFTRSDLIDHTPLELRLCIDYEARILGQLRENKPVRDIEAQISTKNGGLREALVTIERLTIGGVPHLLVMVVDVSERIQLENELRQAQKMEAIGQLAAGVAHDFNNLLTIIQGHASLQLALTGLRPETTDSLREIAQAANRAADLTRQLLAFSRRQIMRPRVIQMNTLLREVTGMLRRLLPETIGLRTAFADTLQPVWADQTGIEQILLNLVVNARDAMPRGGEILIETKAATFTPADAAKNPEMEPGNYVCLSVADTGTGIDEATRSRIFEPFFTTKPVDKGTGMGLATVYGITKQHDGWIDVATEIGKGSIFRVFLPVTTRVEEAAEPDFFIPEPTDREYTILVVEDDEAVRSLVVEVLQHQQYRVLEAEHAEAALGVWQQQGPKIDLLLTDVIMPGINGLELAQQLLADRPELKVIYTSGYSSELFGSPLALDEGRNYLPKPYLSAKLTAIVHAALEPAVAAK
jgi:PAS domain S-box-containing protein